MCEVATAVIGIGATIAGTAVSVYAANKKADAQNAANEYNATVDERNAGYALQDAEYAKENAAYLRGQAVDAIRIGAKDEKNFRYKVAGAIGSQRAGYGASGVDVGSGSAVDVGADTAKFGEVDALTIRYNAYKQAEEINQKAVGYDREALKYNNLVNDLRSNATALRNNKVSSSLAVGGALLNGVSRLTDQYSTARKAGVF